MPLWSSDYGIFDVWYLLVTVPPRSPPPGRLTLLVNIPELAGMLGSVLDLLSCFKILPVTVLTATFDRKYAFSSPFSFSVMLNCEALMHTESLTGITQLLYVLWPLLLLIHTSPHCKCNNITTVKVLMELKFVCFVTHWLIAMGSTWGHNFCDENVKARILIHAFGCHLKCFPYITIGSISMFIAHKLGEAAHATLTTFTISPSLSFTVMVFSHTTFATHMLHKGRGQCWRSLPLNIAGYTCKVCGTGLLSVGPLKEVRLHTFSVHVPMQLLLCGEDIAWPHVWVPNIVIEWFPYRRHLAITQVRKWNWNIEGAIFPCKICQKCYHGLFFFFVTRNRHTKPKNNQVSYVTIDYTVWNLCAAPCAGCSIGTVISNPKHIASEFYERFCECLPIACWPPWSSWMSPGYVNKQKSCSTFWSLFGVL